MAQSYKIVMIVIIIGLLVDTAGFLIFLVFLHQLENTVFFTS
jgi:hypothetical protein